MVLVNRKSYHSINKIYFFTATILGLGLDASMGIYYSPADMSHPLSGAFVGTSYSVGLGLDVSPLSGVDVRLSDQIVIASEVRQIVKF